GPPTGDAPGCPRHRIRARSASGAGGIASNAGNWCWARSSTHLARAVDSGQLDKYLFHLSIKCGATAPLWVLGAPSTAVRRAALHMSHDRLRPSLVDRCEACILANDPNAERHRWRVTSGAKSAASR